MVLRPQVQDLKIIGFYLGKIAIGLGTVMFLPLICGVIFGEINPFFDFLITIFLTFTFGFGLTYFCNTDRELNWMHGMVVVALTWLVAMFLGAVPLFLSGHWQSYLDACFDSMSGFATTGLTLAQDIDHISFTHNLWRHLIMFVGGQGVVIVALSFLVGGTSAPLKMYVGEAREEKILPNVISTARFIWLVSIVYLILGTLALAVTGILEGMTVKTAFFHGICVFMTAFDTGGFAPQSQNILYYHSFPYELVTLVCMFLGAINFKLHYAVWTGNRREIWRNIEIVTLFITITLIFVITAFGLRQAGIYPKVIVFFRKGFYHLLSAHSGTGFMTVYARQFIKEWGALALVGLTIAMAIGGSSCSTTGGIKAIRIGVIFKGLVQDIKRIFLSESAIVVKKIHHIKDIVLDDRQVRSAALITLTYFFLYGLGTVAGVCLGYPLLEALFESTSAAANVGLSCGITTVSMPAVLKIIYIFQMWAGRLEFMAVFTLIGFIIAMIRGKG